MRMREKMEIFSVMRDMCPHQGLKPLIVIPADRGTQLGQADRVTQQGRAELPRDLEAVRVVRLSNQSL